MTHEQAQALLARLQDAYQGLVETQEEVLTLESINDGGTHEQRQSWQNMIADSLAAYAPVRYEVLAAMTGGDA